MNENEKLNDLYNSNNDNNAKKPNVLENEYMALVNIILSAITGAFVTSLYIYHIYFSMRNMSTYSNVKMGETFAIYGNPFSRHNCFKNLNQVLCIPYTKKIDFTAVVKYIPGITDQEPQNLKDTLQIMSNKIQIKIQSKEFELNKKTPFSKQLNLLTNKNTLSINNKLKSNEDKKNDMNKNLINDSQSNHSEIDINVTDLKKKSLTTREVTFDDKIREISEDK